jgi:hypothetical protein
LEERKRIWWAIIILDRAIVIGASHRPLATADPEVDQSLPAEDAAWDSGEMTLSHPINLSTPITEHASPFARLCQASTAMGRVLRHHQDRTLSEAERFGAVNQLHQDLCLLATQLTEEASNSPDYLSFAAALAITFSAISVLLDTYACPEIREGATRSDAESAMQVTAVEGLRAVSSQVRAFAEQLVARTPYVQDVDRVSPLVMDSLYSSAANFAWFVRESGDEGAQVALDELRDVLRRLGDRWRNGAEYLRILEAQEFSYAMNGAVA